MFTALIAILESVLKIVSQYLALQIVKTKLETKTLFYDLDQKEIATGDQMRAKIDAATSAMDLSALSLYLDDQTNVILAKAGIRPTLPDGPGDGGGLGVGSGVSTPPAPDSGPGASQPTAASPAPTQPVISPNPPLVPTKPAIPAPPYAVTGLGTWFGRNPDGSDDKGDVDSRGRDLLGAFGDDCHNETIVGLSIPIPIFHATFGHSDEIYADVKRRRWLFDVFCPQTGKHVAEAWLVDLGPNASLNRPLDMTFGLATMLGLRDNAVCTYWATDTTTGKMVEFKGWNFVAERNLV